MSGFYDGDAELSEEEVDKILEEAARRIKKYGMIMPAIMALESLKPLVFIGGELSRLALTPFFPIFGENMDIWGQKLIYVFEDKQNIDKLIVRLENLANIKDDEEYKTDKPEEESHAE